MNAPKPPLEAFQPGQLVSLLDMIEFWSAGFVRLLVSHSVIWGLIRQFHDVPNNEIVPEEIDLPALRTQLVKMQELAKDLECKGSIPPIRRFIQAIDSSNEMTYGDFRDSLGAFLVQNGRRTRGENISLNIITRYRIV